MRGTLLTMAIWCFGTSAVAQTTPSHNWITPPDKPSAKVGRIAYYTGNTLLELCESSEVACTAYILGAADGQFSTTIATSRDLAYCIPDGSTAAQLRDVVLRYLRQHPEERHRLAAVLVASALAGAWPQC
jgi:hypothetical protein